MVGDIAFRRLSLGDLPFLLDVRNECRECLHDNREFSLSQCEAWFVDQAPEFWIILLEGTRIGYFRTSERFADNSCVMIGADLHMAWRGQGLGYLTWLAFLKKEFSDPSLQTVRLEVLQSNVRASALYSKIGFAADKSANRIVNRQGGRMLSLAMYLSRATWERRGEQAQTS